MRPPRATPQAAFAEHACELLAGIGPVRRRAMFGGHGLYCEDVMVALIADERLYLKVDDATRARFEAAGCTPFVYQAKGDRRIVMSYYEPPADAMDSAEAMRPWARLALQAALRNANAKAAVRRAPAARKR
jgi:DNA transformation protein